MAEEHGGGSGPMGDVIFILGIIGILIILWFASGARKAADLKGIFIHPPSPVGEGGAYGPTIATSSARLQQY